MRFGMPNGNAAICIIHYLANKMAAEWKLGQACRVERAIANEVIANEPGKPFKNTAFS